MTTAIIAGWFKCSTCKIHIKWYTLLPKLLHYPWFGVWDRFNVHIRRNLWK